MAKFYIGQQVKLKDGSTERVFTVRSVNDKKNGGAMVISYDHEGKQRRKEYLQKDLVHKDALDWVAP
ncbi:MAG: hypothetical protein JKY89_06005 [Immundisolibacteraceae bacterium]|nr:hypothetical protein [Immundisolibacteraceae bacterium]